MLKCCNLPVQLCYFPRFNILLHTFALVFRFPKEKKRRDQRIAKVTGDCWQPAPGPTVCSEHFLSTDFHYQWGRRLVKTDGIWTAFSYEPPPKKRKLPKDRQAESVNDQLSSVENAAGCGLAIRTDVPSNGDCFFSVMGRYSKVSIFRRFDISKATIP